MFSEAFQIYGRDRNYPSLFKRSGSTISLIKQHQSESCKLKGPNINIQSKPVESSDVLLFEKALMRDKDYRFAGVIDDLVPNKSGSYYIRPSDFGGDIL